MKMTLAVWSGRTRHAASLLAWSRQTGRTRAVWSRRSGRMRAAWSGRTRHAASLLALLLLTSCDHAELCWDHEAHALACRVLVAAAYERAWEYAYADGPDWAAAWPDGLPWTYDTLRPALPQGIRMLTYEETTDGTQHVDNLPASGGTVRLRAGVMSLLFYNNDTEYILFDDLGSWAEARATTRTRTRTTYLGSPYVEASDTRTVNPPDMLYGHHVTDYVAVRSTDTASLAVTMRPLVFTYVVRYAFASGQQHVALARGALAGMARAVYLNSGRTAAEAATLLFDCTMADSIGAVATVKSFGIPDFPNDHYTRVDATYGLTLEVRLRNGEMLTYDFDVTDQVAAQPHGGVIAVGGIEVPDSIAGAGGSAFDVGITGWGEFEDIVLDL